MVPPNSCLSLTINSPPTGNVLKSSPWSPLTTVQGTNHSPHLASRQRDGGEHPNTARSPPNDAKETSVRKQGNRDKVLCYYLEKLNKTEH